MKPSPEIIAKIRQLQAYNLAVPERFNLGVFGGFANYSKIDEIEAIPSDDDAAFLAETFLSQHPACGAIGCNAGNICIMAGLIKPTEVAKDVALYEFGWDTAKLAAEWLEVDQQTANKLFFLSDWGYDKDNSWPVEFEEELENYEPGTLEYAIVNHRWLDHFCETGE